MKKKINLLLGCGSLIEILLLYVQFVLANPGRSDSYGHYKDEYDITRFDGIKGDIFNWFSNIIEPVTEGKCDLTELVNMLVFNGWMFLSSSIACLMLGYVIDKKHVKCPWVLIVIQSIMAVYWAVYIGFVFLR